MKLKSQTMASGLAADDLQRQGPSVHPFERTHARIGGEVLVELPVADVDGDDAPRPALQQDVGEAAGRGADVEAGEARGIEGEGVERGGELEAPARNVRMGRLRLDRRTVADLGRGFAQNLAVDPDEPGGDRRLGAGAAREEASLDEGDVGAFRHHMKLRANWMGKGFSAELRRSKPRKPHLDRARPSTSHGPSGKGRPLLPPRAG